MIHIKDLIEEVKNKTPCEKHKYTSRREAKKELKRIKKILKSQGKKQPKNFYLCDDCNHFHLTSMTKKQYDRMKRKELDPCNSSNRYKTEREAKRKIKTIYKEKNKILTADKCEKCNDYHLRKIASHHPKK